MMPSPVIFAHERLSLSRWLTAFVTLGLLLSCSILPASAQVNVLTQHNDNFRSGSNTAETILTPANVNATTFGTIGSLPVDGMIAAQPLFMSNVNIPGVGTKNVVYVATLHNSVYAFDSDNPTNSTPLWQVNFLNSAAGITTEPPVELGCTSTTFLTEMGILGAPVIDAASQTMYVLAKTKENGTYHFRLHALDIGSGMEKLGGPVDVNATVNGKLGALMLNGAAKNMLARPALLLSQGTVYLAFGSNGCDGKDTRGWVVAYDASTLLQMGVLNDTPDTKAARGNIWQTGNGLASDDLGNIFFSTANGGFDGNLGGNDYGSSIVKLVWGNNGMAITDYFTPYNVNYLNTTDLDIGSAGTLMLPDQPGPHTHLLVGGGKEGSVYVLDRDNLGHFNPTDNSQIVQFIPFDGGQIPPHSHTPPGSQVGRLFSSPTYWNGFVYIAGQNQGLSQFSLQNDQMVLQNRNANSLCCAHTPSISSNGAVIESGIAWLVNGNGLVAFPAEDVSLPALYSNSTMGTLAHFNIPTIANGRVFVGTKTSLQILGLLANLQTTGGDGQTVPSGGTLPVPLQVTASSPYTGLPVAGVTVTFDAKGKGTFNSVTAVTNSSGVASTVYTAPALAGTYPLTAVYAGSTTTNFTVTVTGGTATHLAIVNGSKQTGALQSTFSAPLVVQLSDASNNGVAGGSITFNPPPGSNNGSFSPNPVVTDSKGRAQSFYTSGTKSGALAMTVTSGSLSQGASETVLAGPATGTAMVSGNLQHALAGTTLPAKIVARTFDQFSNGIPGISITFDDGGVGGTFSPSATATTDSLGRASVSYTLPPTAQVVHITATGQVGSAPFTETAQ